VDSAFAWKQYYAAERTRLGTAVLERLVAEAEPLAVARGGAIVMPHTRLEVTGAQIARVVATVLESGADRVLALGVLHGGRRSDAARVAAARDGDPDALSELRGVHDEGGLASEEFSLDAFADLVELAARRAGRPVDVIRRYPFLVGEDPSSLPGIDELRAIVANGAPLVVTTDPIHHGHAYDTPPEDCCDEHDPSTTEMASAAIDAQLDALSGHRFDEFQTLAAHHRSDFRDTGPVMAALLGAGWSWDVHDVALVDYGDALDAPRPSWVAGALVTVSPAR